MAEVYRFRVGIKELKRTIWREIEILDKASIAQLSYAILATFKAEASHLFSVKYRGARFEIMIEGLRCFREDIYCPIANKLKDLDLRVNDKLQVEYDFGAGWKFDVTLKEIRTLEKGKSKDYPRVIKGKGNGIIEDISPFELVEIVDICKDTQKPFEILDFDGEVCGYWNYNEFDLEVEKEAFKDNFKFVQGAYEKPLGL